MTELKKLFRSLRFLAQRGVPLSALIYPNVVLMTLELIALYLIASLLGGIISTANGAPVDITGAVTLATLLLVKGVISAFLSHVVYRAYERNEASLRNAHFELAHRAPSRWLRSRSFETVTHEVNVYPSNLTYGVYQPAVKLVSDISISLAILLALVVSNPQLTLVVLLTFGVASLILIRVSMVHSREAGQTSDISTIALVNYLARYLSGRNEIAHSSIKDEFLDGIMRTSRALSASRGRMQFISSIPRFAFDGVFGLAVFAIAIPLSMGWASLDQRDLAFGLAAAFKLAPYLTSIISGILQISFSQAIMEGYERAIDDVALSGAQETAFDASVRLENTETGVELELCVNLQCVTVRGGNALVIKGRSGSGKTTIAELIADIAEGRVSSEMTTVVAGLRVAYCSQFSTVLNTSLIRNVSDEIDGRDVAPLIERYGLTHLLNHSSLNENTLSGGERQRVGLVRALAQNSRLIILDEPTASIGTIYAQRLRQDIQELMGRGRMVLIITHEDSFDEIASHLVHVG